MRHAPEGIPTDASRVPHEDSQLIADMRWLGELAARIVKDPGLAQDACQEAWLGATRAKGKAPDRTELIRGVRRALYRHWRSARRRQNRERISATPESLPSVEALLEQREQQQRIGASLLTLEEPYRTTLLLRFQEGLSTQTIAEKSGVAADTVRWRVRQGIALLRKRLESDRESGGLKALVAAVPSALRHQTSSSASALLATPQAVGVLFMSKLLIGLAGATIAWLLFAFLPDDPMLDNGDPPEHHASATFEDTSASEPASPTLETPMPTPANRVPVEDPPAPSPEQILAALRRQPREPFDVPVVRIHLSSSDGSLLPNRVTVDVVAFIGESGIPGSRVEAETSVVDGVVEVPLGTEGAIHGSTYSHGIVTVAADGFGRQESGPVDIGWQEGDVSDVDLVLAPATTIDVLVVHRSNDQPVTDVSILMTGSSADFGERYVSEKGGVLSLNLGQSLEATKDRIFISGNDIAIASWTVEDVLSLPRRADDARHLETWAGCTLSGSVTMESGLPIQPGTELRYSMRLSNGAGDDEYPAGMAPQGQVTISKDGAFEITGLPSGLLLVHLREKSRSIRAPQLSPDHFVPIPVADHVSTHVVIPTEQQVLTLNISWDDQPRRLLFADLYLPADERDGPYANRPGPRRLVAQKHWFTAGEDTQLALPPGTLEEGQPFILRVGLDVDRRIERTITFQGDAPRLEHAFNASDRTEHPAHPNAADSAEVAFRRQAAREVGAQITLTATTAPTLSGH